MRNTFFNAVFDLHAEYEAVFGPLVAGAEVFIRAKLVDELGFEGAWQNSSSIVT